MDQGESSPRKRTSLEKILAATTALFTLATAALAFITATVNNDRQQAQSSAAAAGSDLTTLQSRYNTLQTQVSQLQAQLAQASNTPQTSASTPPPAKGGTQLGSYQFDLIGGREVPLGAKPPSQAEILAGNQGDLTWRNDLGGEPLVPGQNEQMVTLPPGTTPTYEACKTGEHIVKSIADFSTGTAFCVLENTGTVAGVRVAAVNTSTSPSFVTLQVTTWSNQTS